MKRIIAALAMGLGLLALAPASQAASLSASAVQLNDRASAGDLIEPVNFGYRRFHRPYYGYGSYYRPYGGYGLFFAPRHRDCWWHRGHRHCSRY